MTNKNNSTAYKIKSLIPRLLILKLLTGMTALFKDRLLLIFVTLVLSNGVVNASLDTSFDPNADNDVLSIAVQGDGKILIGGRFTNVAGVARNRIARLNADGSLDAGFNPGANIDVNSIALQGDGKILIGGAFTTVGGMAHNSIARLNPDGSLDASFNPNISNINTDVRTLVLSIVPQSDGKILVGGLFTTVGGQARSRVARLNSDGSLDASFDPNVTINSSFEAVVFSIASQVDGKILIGGRFTEVGATARNNIARLNSDGSLDTGFNPDSNNAVYVITSQASGKVLIGGRFTAVGATARNGFVRLNANGSLDTNFDPNVLGSVAAIATQENGKILVGGFIIGAGGVPRNSIARLNADGLLDEDFDPDADFFGSGTLISSIVLQSDGEILIGGSFNRIGGITRNRIARLNADESNETDESLCFPVKMQSGAVAVICL